MAGAARRLLLTETIDPDGALQRWISPDVRRLGWQVWPLPTQEAIHLLGPTAYRSLVLEIVSDLRPDVLLVHPPYDHLDTETAGAIRRAGTRLIGLCFDDALFEDSWDARAIDDLVSRFDRLATTTMRGPTVDAGALALSWALSPECCEPVDPDVETHEVVLVGRRTPHRAAIVDAVAAAGLDVAAYGAGWERGSVSRAQMLGLFRRAGAVITPSDGRDMVKARLLETAAVGARQIVERSSDLAAYFTEGAGPAIFSTPEQCAARLVEGPLHPWSDVPRWATRWPELLESLELQEVSQRPPLRSPALERLHASLAHGYEQRGMVRTAQAFFHALHDAAPGDAGALSGLARCAHAQQRWPDAAEFSQRAIPAWSVPPATEDLSAWIPSHGQGAGLGLAGGLDPRLELWAIRLHSLAMSNDVAAAVTEATALPTRRRQVVAGLLQPNDDPAHAPLWSALQA